jgi:hypothetical protein
MDTANRHNITPFFFVRSIMAISPRLTNFPISGFRSAGDGGLHPFFLGGGKSESYRFKDF